jgi:AcrR family transcriptional regulator
MGVAQRAAARAIEERAARAAAEVSTLVAAGLRVLARRGAEGLTVADVLAEAGLSTRAFYRHFASKAELILAVYERDAEATQAEVGAQVESAPTPQAAVAAWVDAVLALGFEPRRARRTRVLAAEGARLQAEFPTEFAAIEAGLVAPLAEALRRVPTAEPERDAWSVHAVTWSVVGARLRGEELTSEEARRHVLRFCLPALGLDR